MAGTKLDIHGLVSPDSVAQAIATNWQTWHSNRQVWLDEKRELRNYIFATDTKTTSNNKLPWANSTTTPKLTQIYDNLKANYSAALFPNANWLRWKAGNEEASLKEKRDVIQAYMSTKLEQSDFETTVDRLIDDFILYGNCFATVEWVEEETELDTGQVLLDYVGPHLVRISPFDIVFNPAAPNFNKTPKIIRSLVSLGEAEELIRNGQSEYEQVFERMSGNRREVASNTAFEKSDAYIADGFSSIEHYYNSGYVEVLTFYGDIYDEDSRTLLAKRKIIVVDRAYVIYNKASPSWLGHAPVFHSGWRSRPDNLYAMGPLDNLVGMQYRIDHLENLKADVFDQIAYPMLKIRGDVEEFDYKPGTQIHIGEEGDVVPLVPDTTALNADMQINILENKMEELAGAPRQAMGIRTPGEKTAFEVQSLQNAAGRIFQHKAEKFEREFLAPILNAMLEASRRNMDVSDVIRITDDATKVDIFMSITKDDILGSGRLVPVGASHFAERAQRLQNLQNVQMFKGDPTVAPHLSGKKIAEILADELGEKALYGENITVQEQLETQEAMQEAEAQNMENLETQRGLGI